MSEHPTVSAYAILQDLFFALMPEYEISVWLALDIVLTAFAIMSLIRWELRRG